METLLCVMTPAGLVLDMIGVVVLFFCASTKKIEAEISYGILKHFTDKAGEWVHSFSYEEHQRGMARLCKSIRRNRIGLKSGLVLIIVGFLLQLIATRHSLIHVWTDILYSR